jgi:hypothetical protein
VELQRVLLHRCDRSQSSVGRAPLVADKEVRGAILVMEEHPALVS